MSPPTMCLKSGTRVFRSPDRQSVRVPWGAMKTRRCWNFQPREAASALLWPTPPRLASRTLDKRSRRATGWSGNIPKSLRRTSRYETPEALSGDGHWNGRKPWRICTPNPKLSQVVWFETGLGEKSSNGAYINLTIPNVVLGFDVDRVTSIRCCGLRGLNSSNRFQNPAQPFSRFQRGS